jgi:hypothetical protein
MKVVVALSIPTMPILDIEINWKIYYWDLVGDALVYQTFFFSLRVFRLIHKLAQ